LLLNPTQGVTLVKKANNIKTKVLTENTYNVRTKINCMKHVVKNSLRMFGVLAMIIMIAMFSSCTQDEDIVVPSPVEESSMKLETSSSTNVSTRASYNETKTFYYLPQTVEFNTGSCSWYTISFAHNRQVSGSLEIWELSSNGAIISETHKVYYSATGGANYTNSSPAAGTAKVRVTMYGSLLDYGAISIATL